MLIDRHCARCNSRQPLDNFYGKAKKLGYCRPCQRSANRERVLSPEEREKGRLRSAAYYRDNKVRLNEKSRQYVEANKGKTREYQQWYVQNNREQIVQNKKKWAAKNRELHNARSRLWWAERKRDAINAYGGRCYCCGISELDFLTLDHADGNGAEHRRSLGNKSRLYGWLKRNGYPKDLNLRVACFNCNCGAHVNKGICPHERGRLRLVNES